jgi:hypothetical protein
LAEAIETLALNPQKLGVQHAEIMAPFTAHAVAGVFADIFERAARP